MGCSLYGGGEPLEKAVVKVPTDADVMDSVEMLAAHCMGVCESGPCVRVNSYRFEHMSAADVPRLVRDEILPLVNQ